MSERYDAMIRCDYCGRCEIDRVHGACQGCGAVLLWQKATPARPSWEAPPGVPCTSVCYSSLVRAPAVSPRRSDSAVRGW